MDRSQLYKSVRDRSSVALKKKHMDQYDREFESLSQADASMSVLEIGCGTGIFLRYLEKKGYGRVVAVDTDEGLTEALTDLAVAQVHFGDVFYVVAEKLCHERFDRIALYDVIEHIEVGVLFDFMRKLRKLLKPGGKVVLRAPNVSSPWGVKMFFDSFDHVTPMTPGRVREMALATGYGVDGVFEQLPVKWTKRLTQALLHKVFGAALAYHPDIWSANLLAVLSPVEQD